MCPPHLLPASEPCQDSVKDKQMSFYVKAKYDFHPKEPNMLKFHAGAVIEVLGQLESGWWDGLLGQSKRGWFPSNYVDVVSQDECATLISTTSSSVHSARFSVSSATTDSTGSSVHSDFSTGNHAMQQIHVSVQELHDLIVVSCSPLHNQWSESSKTCATAKLKDGIASLTQTIRQIHLILSNLVKADAENNSVTSSGCSGVANLTAVPRELLNQLPMLGVRMHMLTRYLHEKDDEETARVEYVKEQRQFQHLVLEFIDLLISLEQNIVDSHRVTLIQRTESPTSMDDRSCENTYSSDTSEGHSLAGSLSKLGAPLKLSTVRRLSTSELFASLKRFTPVNSYENKSDDAIQNTEPTEFRVPLIHQNVSCSETLLGSDIPPGDIILTNRNTVKGGTLQALVIQLTRHDAFDSKFTTTFLMTYRSFTTSEIFMELLIDRFHVRIPAGLDEGKLQLWEERKRIPIQLRAVNVMRLWLETYYTPADGKALDLVEGFSNYALIHRHVSGMRDMLLRLIKRRREGLANVSRKSSYVNPQPSPVLPIDMEHLDLLSISPVEIARQITMIESDLFFRVGIPECLKKSWTAVDAHSRAKSIVDVISFHNRVTGWVTDSILIQKDILKRAALLSHFIACANEFRKINNFSTMWAVHSALNSASVFRLRATWALLSRSELDTMAQLSQITQASKNYCNYRELLYRISPPCVPFFGLYTKDLTFIEDGNPDQLYSDSRLINFAKRSLTADVLLEIRRFQSTPYNFERVPPLVDFLKGQIEPVLTDEERYERSLKLEPRQHSSHSLPNDLANPDTYVDNQLSKQLRDSGFI